MLVMDCFNVKKRRRHQREKKTFHQLSPHASPAHSQPSTLGHGPAGPGDPRLPKVSSNGLWMGTPSIYSATPSPAYYYGRPVPKPHPHAVQPAVMQRATSESRIPQPVPGPAMYATGSSQRIYHSQQLTPVYEVMDPRSGSVYDVYEFGGSKTRLLTHDGKSSDRRDKSHHHHHHHHHHSNNKRLERSQSEKALAGEYSKRPHRSGKHPGSGQRQSKTNSAGSEKVLIHDSSKRLSGKGGMENPAFRDSSTGVGEKIEEVGEKVMVTPQSATDSMKILAKNKTDDQKTVVHATSSSSTVTSSAAESKVPSSTPAFSVNVPATANFREPVLVPLHYIGEGGDIYAVPLKEGDGNNRRSTADNPILARMQDMVLERSGEEAEGVVRVTSTSSTILDPVTNISQTTEPLMIAPGEGSGSPGRSSVIQNPIYQEVEEVQLKDPGSNLVLSANARARNYAAASAAQSTVTAVHMDTNTGASSPSTGASTPSAVQPESVDMASDVSALASAAAEEVAGASDSAVPVIVDSVESVDAGAVVGEVEQDAADSGAGKAKLDTRWSVDTEGTTTDDLSKAEKHITTTAFDFLDNYLSDEDAGDMQSPPKSPVLSDHGDIGLEY